MNAPEIENEPAEAVYVRAPTPIDTPARRLQTWAEICKGGATNVVKVEGVSWSWTTQPRLQKNGAAMGRVYAQRRGELTRDVGGYKIDAGGRVLQLPAALRAVLPGGLEAEASVDAEPAP